MKTTIEEEEVKLRATADLEVTAEELRSIVNLEETADEEVVDLRETADLETTEDEKVDLRETWR